jgi:hypothetical protein
MNPPFFAGILLQRVTRPPAWSWHAVFQLTLALPMFLLVACSTLAPEKPTVCPVHKVPLEEELVTSHTGSPRFEYEKAHDQLFPFSGTRFSGDFQTRTEYSNLPVCPECRREEQKWLKENRWK